MAGDGADGGVERVVGDAVEAGELDPSLAVGD
jgi:hypothetical protein